MNLRERCLMFISFLKKVQKHIATETVSVNKYSLQNGFCIFLHLFAELRTNAVSTLSTSTDYQLADLCYLTIIENFHFSSTPNNILSVISSGMFFTVLWWLISNFVEYLLMIHKAFSPPSKPIRKHF